MKVGGQIGTSGGDMAKKLKKENKIKDAKIYEGLDVAVMDLKNGVIDVLINDKPVSQEYVVKQKGKIKIVGDNLSEEDFGFAVQKGNKKLLNKINKGLANVKKNGKYNKIYKKWFGEDPK